MSDEPLTNANAVETQADELPAQADPAADLFPTARPAAGSEPLTNGKHEQFCSWLTGWGGKGDPVTGQEAYASAYGTTSEATARVNASRLLARKEVAERCAWMRSQLADSVLADKAAIRADLLTKRYEIVKKTIHTKDKALALAAMRDIEAGLGLNGSADSDEQPSATAQAVASVGAAIEAVAKAFQPTREKREK